jgi:hypothetical protein
MGNRNDERYRQGSFNAGYDDRNERGPYGSNQQAGESAGPRQDRQGFGARGQNREGGGFGGNWDESRGFGGGEPRGRDWQQPGQDWQGRQDGHDRPEWQHAGGDAWRTGSRGWQQGGQGAARNPGVSHDPQDWRSQGERGDYGDQGGFASYERDRTQFGPSFGQYGRNSRDYPSFAADRSRSEAPYGYGQGYSGGGYGNRTYESRELHGWRAHDNTPYASGAPWQGGDDSRYESRTQSGGHHRGEGVQGFFENVKEGVRHAFQGLKGYKWSDERVREDVCDRMQGEVLASGRTTLLNAFARSRRSNATRTDGLPRMATACHVPEARRVQSGSTCHLKAKPGSKKQRGSRAA